MCVCVFVCVDRHGFFPVYISASVRSVCVCMCVLVRTVIVPFLLCSVQMSKACFGVCTCVEVVGKQDAAESRLANSTIQTYAGICICHTYLCNTLEMHLGSRSCLVTEA